MKNLIYIRGTIDWENCNIDNYCDMNRRSPRYIKTEGVGWDRPDFYLDKVRMWNSTLKTDFFRFRYNLNQIQKKNIADLNGLDIVLNYFDLSILDSLDDYIILCVDDDDWFRPDIFDVLRNLQFQWDGVAWFMSWIGFVDSGLKICKNTPYSSFKTFTNNFAFKKSGYEKCRNIKDMLENHWYVNNACYANKDFNYKPFDDFLSISVKSPASITSLLQIENRNQLVEAIEKKMPISLPDELGWAKNYYDEYLSAIRLLQRKIYL